MCSDICPKNAIRFTINDQGFWYPTIDDALCIHCNRCKINCPANTQKKYEKSNVVLAMWNKDTDERLQATSGGVFCPLAESVLNENGVVYGAGFDEKNHVCHQRIDSVAELGRLRGSKYIQSNTAEIYNRVLKDLKNGYKVLFSGTPCQVSALRTFLGKEYSSLICVDIVCHGVPSPKVFEDYLKNLSQEYGSDPVSINFRYKKPGWSVFSMKIDFANGASYEASKFKDPFLNLFLAGKGKGDLILRPSCFECRFTSPERAGDLTIGDFWGIKALDKSQADQEKGVNIVIVNSPKGEKLLHSIENRMSTRKKGWEDAFVSNQSFIRPWKKPELYDAFWKSYHQMNFSQIVNHYTQYDSAEEQKKLSEARKRASMYRDLRFMTKYYIKKIIKLVRP